MLSSGWIKLQTCMFRLAKVSFEDKFLYNNIAALVQAVRRNRPASSKGTYIRKIVLTTTMGPGIKLDTSSALTMEISE